MSEAKKVLTVDEWLEAAPLPVKRMFAGSISVINFWHDYRNRCFQIPGANDGSISEECKAGFREQYEICDAVVRALKNWNDL